MPLLVLVLCADVRSKLTTALSTNTKLQQKRSKAIADADPAAPRTPLGPLTVASPGQLQAQQHRGSTPIPASPYTTAATEAAARFARTSSNTKATARAAARQSKPVKQQQQQQQLPSNYAALNSDPAVTNPASDILAGVTDPAVASRILTAFLEGPRITNTSAAAVVASTAAVSAEAPATVTASAAGGASNVIAATDYMTTTTTTNSSPYCRKQMAKRKSPGKKTKFTKFKASPNPRLPLVDMHHLSPNTATKTLASGHVALQNLHPVTLHTYLYTFSFFRIPLATATATARCIASKQPIRTLVADI